MFQFSMRCSGDRISVSHENRIIKFELPHEILIFLSCKQFIPSVAHNIIHITFFTVNCKPYSIQTSNKNDFNKVYWKPLKLFFILT